MALKEPLHDAGALAKIVVNGEGLDDSHVRILLSADDRTWYGLAGGVWKATSSDEPGPTLADANLHLAAFAELVDVHDLYLRLTLAPADPSKAAVTSVDFFLPPAL
jgi:hypothetical protein